VLVRAIYLVFFISAHLKYVLFDVSETKWTMSAPAPMEMHQVFVADNKDDSQLSRNFASDMYTFLRAAEVTISNIEHNELLFDFFFKSILFICGRLHVKEHKLFIERNKTISSGFSN
jgi:hypothetical protein